MKLEALVEAWSEARQPALKMLAGARRAVAQFVSLLGDLSVGEIVADDLFDYRDAVACLPRTLSITERRLTFEQLIGHIERGVDSGPRVTRGTVQKQLRYIQGLLIFAFRERWIADNVGRDVPAIGSTGCDRRPFTGEEARAVFALPLFAKPWSSPARKRQISNDTLRWLMLIALTTGARLEEIGQLQPTDILTDEGIIHLVIDEVDAGGRKSASKNVKTASSKRRVPLHSDLLKLGLYEKAQQRLHDGAERLFLDLPRDEFGRYTREASRYCNRLIDKVTTDPRLVFHSFRHFFKDQCREAGILESVSDQLTGHAPVTVGGRYGNGVSLTELKAQLERLRFEFIDWEKIYAASRA